MSLIDVLKQVPDFRKARGQRHPLWVVLVMMIMGNLAGYHGNRPLGEFAQRYGVQVAQLLEIELTGPRMLCSMKMVPMVNIRIPCSISPSFAPSSSTLFG
ncbi:MAG: transposase family protein [Moorea sp. SIO3C2]|nr:transposase family protein [Moorena sp. SIO3C2]